MKTFPNLTAADPCAFWQAAEPSLHEPGDARAGHEDDAVEENLGARCKPSGVHRIQRTSFAPAPRDIVAAPRHGLIASTHLVLAMSVLAIGLRFFAQSAWLCTFLWIAPLVLLFLRDQRATWALYSGVMWVALAALELFRPVEIGTYTQLRGALSLCVLGMILLSLRRAYRGIQELSRRDPLTGLLNRRGFEELGRLELARASRYKRPISFALLDLDRFKEVNDRYGHQAGDRVLQLVAAQLRELRRTDLAVRLGGDEFGVLMPETDTDGAQQLIARLQQSIHERMREQGWPVTLSVGISDLPARIGRMDTLLDDADRRMYEAKARYYEHAAQ